MTTKITNTYVSRSIKTYQNDVLSTSTNQICKLERKRVGIELPGWSAKIRSKEVNATTPLDASEGILQGYSPGSVSVIRSNGAVFKQLGFSDSNWNPPQVTAAQELVLDALQRSSEATALGKAYSKIQGVMNPFGASVLLGELKETIGFLRSPLEQSIKLSKALTGAMRGNTKTISSILKGKNIYQSNANLKLAKAYASSLLELRFGILPLVNDSIAILELAQTIAARNNILTFRTYGVSESSATVISTYQPSLYAKCTQEVTTEYKVETIIRFGIKEVIDGDGSVYDYTKRSLLDLANVPEVIWELTYLSWLIDYFVNVNDVLASVTTSTRSVIWQSKSVIRTKTVRSVLRNWQGANGGIITDSSNQVTTVSFRSVKRTNDALTIPSVVLRVPGYKQLQNVAAFLVQKL